MGKEPCIECQSNDKNGDDCKVERAKCGHMFHCHCITQWLQARSVCPLCNRPWAGQQMDQPQTAPPPAAAPAPPPAAAPAPPPPPGAAPAAAPAPAPAAAPAAAPAPAANNPAAPPVPPRAP